MHTLIRWRVVAVIVAVSAMASCREQKTRVDIVSMEGRIEKIDARPDGTGKITVVFRDKDDRETTGVGEITNETEIMVAGAAAGIGDLKVGDRVRGEVRILREGRERRQVALKIVVERAAVTPTPPAEAPPAKNEDAP